MEHLTFTDAALEKVKFFLENADEAGMALRILVKERTADGFKYAFSLDPYENEHDDDLTLRVGGFATRLDPESAKWLQGATVDWKDLDGKEGFAVDNPNPPMPNAENGALEEEIVSRLKTIFDPEIPVNIYDLGLIYGINVQDGTSEGKKVVVTMTLTAPNCPAAESLPLDVKTQTESVIGVDSAEIDLTWEPPWTPENMSEEAKLDLGL